MNQIKTFVYFFFLFIYNNLLLGQAIDSLKSSLVGLNDAERITAYLKIGTIYSDNFGKPDSLLFYSNKAHDLAKSINDKDGVLKSNLQIAIAYQKKNTLDTSIVILEKMISDNPKLSDDNLNGDIKYNLGLNYRLSDNNKLAIANFVDAIQHYEKAKNITGLATCFVKLAGTFTIEKQTKQSLFYARKANSLLSDKVEPNKRIGILSTLSGVYINASMDDKTLIDSSIYFAEEALKLVDEYKYYTKGNQLCVSICNAHTLRGDFEKSLEYCKKSMNYKSYLFPSEIIVSYLNFGDCYINLKNYKLGLTYLDSSLSIARELNDPFYQMQVYERVYLYNKEANNVAEALMGLEKFKNLKDSLFNVERSTSINELEQKYNKSENEKKINELNRENEIASLNVKILVVAILAAILVILVIIFFYRQSVLKNKFEMLETEQRLNRARMNPHFFFNALASIQTLSMDAENQSKVSSLISKFSKIMRQSLESTYDELATIEDEISFLSNYLDIQKTRFNNKFDYKISVDENLELDELKVLGMLLQPFIENSIEHGFKNIDYKGQLDIIFKKEENGIRVEVKDNGVGFNTEKLNKEYPSRATQITSERLQILNRQHKSKAGYEITANPDGKGISVIVQLPLIY